MKLHSKTTFIYALHDPLTDSIRYVGKADNPKRRFNAHLWGEKHNFYRSRWIAKLKRANLRPRLSILKEVSVDNWQFWEKAFIKLYRRRGCRLVNLTEGGEGTSHYRHSAESKAKISASNKVASKRYFENGGIAHMKGKHHSLDAKEKNRQAHLGVAHTEAARQKISVGLRGRQVSSETRAKISSAHIGVPLTSVQRRHMIIARRMQSTLSWQDVTEIRLLAKIFRQAWLARIYGVSDSLISAIVLGKRWANEFLGLQIPLPGEVDA
jgi:hypothetical protein